MAFAHVYEIRHSLFKLIRMALAFSSANIIVQVESFLYTTQIEGSVILLEELYLLISYFQHECMSSKHRHHRNCAA